MNVPFNSLLIGLRALSGLSQKQAADRAGLSLRTIASAEQGKASIKTRRALVSLYEGRGVVLTHPEPGRAIISLTASDILEEQAPPG